MDGRVKLPVSTARSMCWCRAVLEGDGTRGCRAQCGCWGTPAHACMQGRVQVVGSGRDFESQGWSDALSHQRCLTHPIHETVALIKPKRSFN